jgi:hypothetical protein
MELNCGRETQLGQMEEIPFDVVESWDMLIRANIFDGEGLSLADLSKSCRIIGKTLNVIVIPHEFGVEDELRNLQNVSPYTVHFIDMHTRSLP